MREGGENCLKYLKRGWNRKDRTRSRKFKKMNVKLCQGLGTLKKGDWKPLTNYATFEQTS